MFKFFKNSISRKQLLYNQFDYIDFHKLIIKNKINIRMDTITKEVHQKENVKYIVGLGNPIIDISATVEEESLKTYKLEYGRTVFKNDENVGIYDHIESQKDVSYIPGGSITNSIRITNVI
jgi:hypothetical protein